MHTLKRKQFLPISLEEAWKFFSSPANLKRITPDYMGFEITSDLGDGKMYSGQLITYTVKPVLGIPMKWVTEIKAVEAPYYFIDEQRVGPYQFWHHQHRFKEVEGGVEMTDIVNYALPLGLLGDITHSLFVKRQLEDIFDYRRKVVEKRFHKKRAAQESRPSLVSN